MRPVFKSVREARPPRSSMPMPRSATPCRARHEPGRRQVPRQRRGRGVGVQLASLRGRRLLLADRRRARRDRDGDVVDPRRHDGADVRAEPVMGTNPLAFAAPTKRNPPFQLDMATTTVAAGKVKVYKLNHKPLPSGWVVDGDGRTVTEPERAFRLGLRPPGRRHHAARRHARRRQPQGLRPRGDGPHPGRHAVRRLVLADPQPHAGPLRPAQHRALLPRHRPARLPRRGRVRGGPRPGDRHAAQGRPADPGQPVLVAGDPEMATREERLRTACPCPTTSWSSSVGSRRPPASPSSSRRSPRPPLAPGGRTAMAGRRSR